MLVETAVMILYMSITARPHNFSLCQSEKSQLSCLLALFNRYQKGESQADFTDFYFSSEAQQSLARIQVLIADRGVLYCISVCLGVWSYGKSKNMDASRVGSARIRSF